MKYTSKIILPALILFPIIALSAPISTHTGFVYPANMKHADSSYIGFSDRNTSFGNRCHLADDYNMAENSPVYATGPGTVERASDSIPFYGGDDGRGWFSTYY